jgi:cysteine desulfurase
MGVAPELLRASIRFSVAADTTEAEVDHAVAVVPRVVEKLRRISPVYE